MESLLGASWRRRSIVSPPLGRRRPSSKQNVCHVNQESFSGHLRAAVFDLGLFFAHQHDDAVVASLRRVRESLNAGFGVSPEAMELTRRLLESVLPQKHDLEVECGVIALLPARHRNS
jgi:hypothetical protein